jgi:tetratricopeptide (TPR) repeat protein
MNLIPADISDGILRIKNDGKRLLSIPRLTGKEIQSIIFLSKAVEIPRMLAEHRDAEVAKILDQHAEAIKEMPWVMHLNAVLLMGHLNFNEAEKWLNAVIGSNCPDELLALAQNNLAWIKLLQWTKESLGEGERLSASAHNKKPDEIAIRSTYGSILIASGQYERGLSYLARHIKFDQPINERTNHPTLFLMAAYAYWGLGEAEKVTKCLLAIKGKNGELREIDKYLIKIVFEKTGYFDESIDESWLLS